MHDDGAEASQIQVSTLDSRLSTFQLYRETLRGTWKKLRLCGLIVCTKVPLHSIECGIVSVQQRIGR
jgi:hypothetical protein